jgi:predicted ABC-type ATPase
VIRRRFESGLKNCQQVYKQIVDEWMLYDKSGEQPVLIDEGYNYD